MKWVRFLKLPKLDENISNFLKTRTYPESPRKCMFLNKHIVYFNYFGCSFWLDLEFTIILTMICYERKKENQNNFSINNFKFFVSSRTSGYPDDLLMNSLVSGIWNSCSSIGWESLNWVSTTAQKKWSFPLRIF